MSKSFFKIALPIILLAIILAFLYSFYLPYAAHKTVQSYMAEAGFSQLPLPKPQTGRDYVMYQNIVLDPDGISTIDTLAAQYSLINLLFFHRFERIQIQGLSLTGEMHFNQSPTLDFSGWQAQNILSSLQALPARELNLKNAKFSLLTDDFSGVSLTCDLQAKRSHDYVDIQMNINSTQRNLSFAINGTGRIQKGMINLEMEMERGKIEWNRAQLKASRTHGQSTYTQDSASYKAAGEFEIGGMSFLGMPWQNVGTSIEMNDGYLKIIAGGKSVGIDGLEIGIDIEKFTGRPASYSAFVHFDSLKNFLGYYYQDRFSDLSESDLSAIENIQNLTAYFVAAPSKDPAADPGIFDLTSSLEHPNFEGTNIKHQMPLNVNEQIKPTTLFDALLTQENLVKFTKEK
jgi:hypothetical protein